MQQRHRAVIERHVQELAFARAAALDNRHQDGDHDPKQDRIRLLLDSKRVFPTGSGFRDVSAALSTIKNPQDDHIDAQSYAQDQKYNGHFDQ